MMRTNQTIPPSQQIQEETAVVNFLNAILIPFYFVFPGSLWSFCFGNRKKRIVPPSASHQLCRCGCFSSSNWFPLPLLMSTPFPHPCEQTWRLLFCEIRLFLFRAKSSHVPWCKLLSHAYHGLLPKKESRIHTPRWPAPCMANHALCPQPLAAMAKKCKEALIHPRICNPWRKIEVKTTRQCRSWYHCCEQTPLM